MFECLISAVNPERRAVVCSVPRREIAEIMAIMAISSIEQHVTTEQGTVCTIVSGTRTTSVATDNQGVKWIVTVENKSTVVSPVSWVEKASKMFSRAPKQAEEPIGRAAVSALARAVAGAANLVFPVFSRKSTFEALEYAIETEYEEYATWILVRIGFLDLLSMQVFELEQGVLHSSIQRDFDFGDGKWAIFVKTLTGIPLLVKQNGFSAAEQQLLQYYLLFEATEPQTRMVKLYLDEPTNVNISCTQRMAMVEIGKLSEMPEIGDFSRECSFKTHLDAPSTYPVALDASLLSAAKLVSTRDSTVAIRRSNENSWIAIDGTTGASVMAIHDK